MKSNKLKTIIGIFSFVVFVSSCHIGERNTVQKPNVLLIFSDDHQASAIKALGNPYIKTPSIDKLVREGTSMVEAFTETPTCAPSRAALLTGCGSLTHGTFYPGYTQSANKKLKRWPQVMQDAGYQTFWTGKFNAHGKPSEWGIEETSLIFQRGMGEHNMILKENGKEITGFSSEIFADALIDFINKPYEKPFFATVAFTAPHDPRTPPKKYARLYKANEVPLPANFMSHYNYQDGYDSIRDEMLLPYPRKVDDVKKEIAAYYGLISHMDEQIGRIMGALKANGLEENTIVIYASDNGLALGNHGLLGKFSFYDHSLKVPLIMKGPAIQKNYKSNVRVYLHDLFPTICTLTGVEIPSSVESKSFVSALKGDTTCIHKYMFGSLSNLKRSVSTKDYKLIRHYRSNWHGKIKGTDEYLFLDLKNDPLEIINKINDTAFSEIILELKEVLRNRQIEKKDFLSAE